MVGREVVLLIRLAPYPFNLVNLALAVTNISLPRYSIATALSLFKLNTHVLIGANLVALNQEIQHPSFWHLVSGIAALSLGIGVMVYLWWLARKITKASPHLSPIFTSSTVAGSSEVIRLEGLTKPILSPNITARNSISRWEEI